MAYLIGSLIGALIITLLLSRVFRKWPFGRARGLMKAVGPNVLTLVLATVLGGFGNADGGSPQFLRAAGLYVLPVCLWTIVDLARGGRGGKGDASHAEDASGGGGGSPEA